MTSGSPRRVVSWYGEGDGEEVSYAAPLAKRYADRYRATGVLRRSSPPVIVGITVEDSVTGAVFAVDRDGHVSITGAPFEDVLELAKDFRQIVGTIRAGGPPVGTGLQPPQVVAKVLELWLEDPEPDGTAPTAEKVAHALAIDVRTIRRVGARLAGPGKPYDRLIREARVLRRDDVRLASSRSRASVADDPSRDGRHNEPPPLVTGHAHPAADKSGHPPVSRRR